MNVVFPTPISPIKKIQSPFSNFFEIDLRNLNSVGKNNSDYKSSPQVEFMSIINLNSSFPLLKQTDKDINYLTPKVSLRYSPNGNTDLSAKDIILNYDSAFDLLDMHVSCVVVNFPVLSDESSGLVDKANVIAGFPFPSNFSSLSNLIGSSTEFSFQK